MARTEHVEIIKKGVEEWNKWRDENPTIVPYLRGANLYGADLGGAYLSNANLSEADLSGAILLQADLSKANLNGANLSGADLRKANLRKANLNGANLRKADLSGVDLSEVELIEANLNGANLFGADLQLAVLRGADLSVANFGVANLMGADLRSANFIGAGLYGANLIGADLSRADLYRADLSGAQLDEAELHFCGLIQCDLTSASLTGVRLYGTSRDDWIIKDVKCDYVYWDDGGKIKIPRDRVFEPGEFENLYKVLPTIEYVFGDGMTPIDPLIMDHVVEKIRQKIPEFDIKIDSISARGLAPSIKLTVKHEEQKEKALAEVKAVYETEIKRLETQKDDLLELIKIALKEPKYKLLNAAPGSIVATDGSTINVQRTVYIYHIEELRKAIQKAPKKRFTKIAKDKALGIVQGALDDIAKDAVKDAAKKIVGLGTMLAPTIIEQIPHVFEIFKNLGQ